jgi:uncharacterized protein (TIGR03382 family)
MKGSNLMHRECFACALVATVGLAMPASGTVYFTFDDPDTGLEVRHEQPTSGGDPFGTMTYAEGGAPTVDFIVDVSDESFAVGDGLHTFECELRWTNWEVMPVTDLGLVRTSSVRGEFEFYDINENQTVLTGSFEMGMVVESMSAGSVITASEGDLTYAPGEALTDIYPALQFTPFWDGVYTLTDITFDDQPTVDVDNETYFGSFRANAAFTGTTQAIIPTPGALALAGLGLAAITRRRRH